MKVFQVAALAGALLLSPVVFAESGGDMVFARMMEARDRALERNAVKAAHQENDSMVASDAKDKDEAADKD
ncbi:hypothetical protein AFK24_29340 [Pseudomonas syringae]|uniref:Secreted protein n=1 Tax=Pseudomonas syringae TaxID=317 RepID=A0A1C7YVW0_PSESX|nr:co-regulatory protein PtrA N-terminal domain-containing protein [Pseudomonas syringae]OCR21653.1 hypothetical protein AFK24_29340 [Pseudomonas syringae]